MSYITQELRDLEDLRDQYQEASGNPAALDAVLDKVRRMYGIDQAVNLLNRVKVKRTYYKQHEEPIQEHA
jgi:hypothetical protein